MLMKAKGRWPFSESGMGTTHDSVIDGCDEMDCSIEPVFEVSFYVRYQCVLRTYQCLDDGRLR